MADILADIDDLIRQSETDRSHHYTASVLKRARAEIVELRKHQMPHSIKLAVHQLVAECWQALVVKHSIRPGSSHAEELAAKIIERIAAL